MQELVAIYRLLYSEKLVKDSRSLYELKLRIISQNLYGVDIDSFATNIAMLRLWLSLSVEAEKPLPLPNLEFKIETGDSLTGPNPAEMPDLFRDGLQTRAALLAKLKEKYQNAHGLSKEVDYRAIQEEQDAIAVALNVAIGPGIIDWRVHFAEVFGYQGGFDVAIGNPPYGATLGRVEKLSLDLRFSARKSANKNSAIYFTYVAEQITTKTGVISFIVPKSLCYSIGWGKCAKSILPSLMKLIDSGKAFERVKLEQVIFVARSEDHGQYFTNGLYSEGAVQELAEVPKTFYNKHRVLLAGQSEREVNLIFRITAESPKTLGDYVRVQRGLNWQAQVENHPGNVPVFRGAQLSRFYIWPATDFIDLAGFGPDTYGYQQLPKILNQLAVAHVKNPYPHFLLQAELDTENKIVFETISCTFAKDERLDLKFLLGLNNSKLFCWLLYKFIYSNAIRSTRYDEKYVARLPCPDLVACETKPIITLVERIREAKRSDPAADTGAMEREIDQLVYKLYNLTPEEISIVEGESK